jgi:uncharacterized membrane protein YkgB
LPPKADIRQRIEHVCFVPIPDASIASNSKLDRLFGGLLYGFRLYAKTRIDVDLRFRTLARTVIESLDKVADHFEPRGSKAMAVHFQVAEMASGSYWHLAFLRWSIVAIFIWFGIQKFTPYAAEAIAPLIANSPFMRWLRVFGVRGEAKIIGKIELTTAAVLILGSVIPIASAVGAAMACATFLLTMSFFFSTPGVTQKSSTGFPIISTLLGQFLLKDIALLAASFTLLLASLSL